MLANTLTLTWGAASVTLTKIREGGYSSEYRGDYTTGAGWLRRMVLNISHTMPFDQSKPMSHLVRLDVHRYDADGALADVQSVWTVIKSTKAATATEVDQLNSGLQSILTSAFATQIGAGES